MFHGPRFDVYAEDDQGIIYDFEMQNEDQHDLAERISIYQGNLSRQALYAGQPFKKRKRTVVFFICDHDPYGLGWPSYTLKVELVGCPNFSVDNKETNVIVNLKTDVSQLTQAQREMVVYFNDGTVSGAFSQKLAAAVAAIKADAIRGGIYMTIEEYAALKSAYAQESERIKTITGLAALDMSRAQIIEFLKTNMDLSEEEAQAAYDNAMAAHA
ncbi:Rpn family recombination-promoting nuclease/putative transposase [Ligilactobacillus agilis]|uniref:Rpn family recombination-promoting nuclease/putative transposase n=1 Tax=Ligilactobacillus agilis TaxID=1601 RepID=A0A9Q9J8W7_9LACO|nr:Rpn family recombination-promoting nuclease/putative transposase [Ligilactobacillus agilis]UXC66530.1 Rpn family recombination-promoting nuclease/putative transposase [Ligilactobacillus agilis]